MAKYRSRDKIIADAKLKKLLETFGNMEAPDVNYHEKLVKINQDKYKDRIERGELSNGFVQWYEENKDNEFTAKDYKSPYMSGYTLDNVSPWTFPKECLMSKCLECGEFIDMSLYYCKHCGKEYIEETENNQ